MVKSPPSVLGTGVQPPQQGTKVPHATGQLTHAAVGEACKPQLERKPVCCSEGPMQPKERKVSGVLRQRNPALEIVIQEGGRFQESEFGTGTQVPRHVCDPKDLP